MSRRVSLDGFRDVRHDDTKVSLKGKELFKFLMSSWELFYAIKEPIEADEIADKKAG